jgi:hypothetical protein
LPGLNGDNSLAYFARLVYDRAAMGSESVRVAGARGKMHPLFSTECFCTKCRAEIRKLMEYSVFCIIHTLLHVN